MATDCLFKITIQLKEAIEREDRLITHINIPCGKCGRCLQRRKAEWSFRMYDEMIHSKTSYFVTMTFAPETVPYNKYGKKTLITTRAKDLEIKKQEEGWKRVTKKRKGKLIDRSLEGFFKRVRQNQKRTDVTIETLTHGLTNKDKIKYYGCGEYGENNTKRPHYHAIIFNASAQAIEKSWTLGDVQIKPASMEAIMYVMKYLDKRLGAEENFTREKEFNTMSEGIGLNYINKMKHWHKQNIDILYVMTEKGIKVPMPKYFRDKIFTEEERKEQVLIVSEHIENVRMEEILKRANLTQYNEDQAKLKNETERRFKKNIKKRTVD